MVLGYVGNLSSKIFPTENHAHPCTNIHGCLFFFVYNFSPLSIVTSSALLCHPLSKTLTIHTHLGDIPRNSVFLKDNLLAISYQEKKISDYILFIYILLNILSICFSKEIYLYHSRVFLEFYIRTCVSLVAFLFILFLFLCTCMHAYTQM